MIIGNLFIHSSDGQFQETTCKENFFGGLKTT